MASKKVEKTVKEFLDGVKDSENFYDNFIGLSEEESIGIFDYIPKNFLRKEIDFDKYFTSPTAVIILENKGGLDALVYRKGLFRFKKNNEKVRYGSLPKEFDELVLKMLRHYNEFGLFSSAAEKTASLPITKSVACLFFDKKRYLFPLSFSGKNAEKQAEVRALKETMQKIFAELIQVVGKKAESYFHNLDLDSLAAHYKKCQKREEQKSAARWPNVSFDF